jgi:hypothetical protein
MHGIKVLMAKNYVDNLSEETRKGMLENRASGLRLRRSDTATSTGLMVRKLSRLIPMSRRSSPGCSTGTRPAAFL